MADRNLYPQPPQYSIPNPLQEMEQMQAMGLRAAEMKKVQQATQLQALTTRADSMFGQLLQSTMNPETGEPDLDRALALAAQHPETAIRYPQYLEATAHLGQLNADRHIKELDRGQKSLDVAHNSFLPYADRLNDPSHPIEEGDVMSIFGTMRNYLPKKDVDLMMNDYLSKRSQKQTTPAEYVKGGLFATKQGLEALQASQGSFAERNQLVEDPQTGMKIPYFEYLKRQGLAARGYAAAEASMQQNTVERGSAPPPSPQLGGAEQPSAPAPAPTTSGYPSGYLGGAQKEFYQEQAKSFATQAEKIGTAASNAADSQTQITELKKILPKIESQLGLLSKEGLTTAKFFAQIDPDDRFAVVQKIYGESDPKKQKEIISNLEAFDKLTLLENVEAAKAAIGARVTNNEFQKFSTALTNLRTTGKGAKQILDFMEKLNKIIQMKNAYMASYRDTHRGMKHQFDLNEFERGWNEALKSNPKLYKFESPTEEE